MREWTGGTTESKTLSPPRLADGNSMHGNRETSKAPPPDAGEGRSQKATRRTADMHAVEESDDLIVPKKRANKAVETAAEPVEGSGSAKGNVRQDTASRTQSRKAVSIDLEGVRQVASRDKDVRFTALLHHVNPEQLRTSYFQLRKRARLQPRAGGQ